MPDDRQFAAGRVSRIVYPGPSFSVVREYTASGRLNRLPV